MIYAGFRDYYAGYPNVVLRLKKGSGAAVRVCERINVALAVVKALLPGATRSNIGVSEKGEVRVHYREFIGTVVLGGIED